MGAIHVHEFMTLAGVIDAPAWTFDYEFLPEMLRDVGAVTGRCRGILLGRTTYEMFEPAWSTRTVEEDPGAPFFNDTTLLGTPALMSDWAPMMLRVRPPQFTITVVFSEGTRSAKR